MKRDFLNSATDRTIQGTIHDRENIEDTHNYDNQKNHLIENDAKSFEFNDRQSVMGQNTEKTERLNGVDSKQYVTSLKENSTRTASKTCETCGW
jgi:hypothetical protein